MADKPRYRLRANSPALTRMQWWIFGIAICVVTCSLLLVLAGKEPLAGGMVGAAAAITASVTVMIAQLRDPGE